MMRNGASCELTTAPELKIQFPSNGVKTVQKLTFQPLIKWQTEVKSRINALQWVQGYIRFMIFSQDPCRVVPRTTCQQCGSHLKIWYFSLSQNTYNIYIYIKSKIVKCWLRIWDPYLKNHLRLVGKSRFYGGTSLEKLWFTRNDGYGWNDLGTLSLKMVRRWMENSPEMAGKWPRTPWLCEAHRPMLKLQAWGCR